MDTKLIICSSRGESMFQSFLLDFVIAARHNAFQYVVENFLRSSNHFYNSYNRIQDSNTVPFSKKVCLDKNILRNLNKTYQTTLVHRRNTTRNTYRITAYVDLPLSVISSGMLSACQAKWSVGRLIHHFTSNTRASVCSLVYIHTYIEF